MKVVIVIVGLALLYLFYPFRDLYVREDPFAETYTLEARGFWLQQQCDEAGRGMEVAAYRCVRHSLWSKLLRTYGQYDPAIRESLKNQE